MTAAIVLGVGWLVGMLVMACIAQARENREAREELDERIQQLQQMVSSVARTGGRSARLMRRRAQPFKAILQDITPATGRPLED
jgi:uncharacterized membrane-anchored protein YhcB (DUF1043 family)